jgi:hypothetical protein
MSKIDLSPNGYAAYLETCDVVTSKLNPGEPLPHDWDICMLTSKCGLTAEKFILREADIARPVMSGGIEVYGPSSVIFFTGCVNDVHRLLRGRPACSERLFWTNVASLDEAYYSAIYNPISHNQLHCILVFKGVLSGSWHAQLSPQPQVLEDLAGVWQEVR